MRSFTEHGSDHSPAASIAWEYDANGNIRRNTASYRTLDQQGNAAAASTSTDYWFRYDNMNRLVTDRGILRGGQIVRGEGAYGAGAGQDILYNAAGERVAVLTTAYTPGSYDYYSGSYEAASYAEARESYVYDAAGRLIEVQESRGGAAYEGYDYTTGQFSAPTTLPAAATGGTVRSRFVYDLLGRQTGQTDYQANGTTVVFSRSATFNTKSQLVADDSTTRKSDGTSYRAVSSYDYGSGSDYALGSALTISTINYKNNNDADAPDTLTTNSYAWWDGAVQNGITHKPNTAQSTSYYTGFGYNDLGQLTRASIADGRQRTVTFRLNADGQILRRDEADNVASTGDPHEVWYRFNGRQLGSTGNNGTNDLRNAASIAEREQLPPTGPAGAFRGGQTQSITHADFADSSDAINSYSQGSSAGGYTVRSGDTLAGIAQNLWGDAGLWYKLAQANGLSGSGGGSASPTAGTVLMLPAGVVRSTYNASTLTPYNPAEAIGDLTPSTPTPQAPKKNKCGVFGQILLAVVAIAVTLWASPASPTLWQGVIAGAAGSIASQGVGLATGIQKRFDFKGLALAAISGGIGGTELTKLGPIAGSKFLGNVVGGALASAATQGIAVATGLQSKFDFVGVAAAGIGAGIGGAVGRSFRAPTTELAQFGQRLAVSTASGLANAATRSAISGTSFGENIIAALPDIIGQAVGGFLGNRLTAKAGGRSGGEGASPAENALLAEAQNSANRAPAAEANGTNIRIERSRDGNIQMGTVDDIVVTAKVNPAVYRFSDQGLFFQAAQYRTNPRGRIGGNGGPSIYDPMTLQRVFPGLQNGPAGAVIGLVDNALDIFGPRNMLISALSKDYSSLLIDQIKTVDPSYRFDSLGFPSTFEGQMNQINGLRADRAEALYRVYGEIAPLQLETLRFMQVQVDAAYTRGLQELQAGRLDIRLSPQEALGNYVDRTVRNAMRTFYNQLGVSISKGEAVQVNRRAGNASEGSYTVPDSRVGNVAFDVSLTRKTLSTPQVRGFFNSDFRPSTVVIVRPSQLGPQSTYAIKRPR